MPVYEYECKICHEVFELSRSVAERNGVVCQGCGGPTQIIISTPTVYFFKDYYDRQLGHITGPKQRERRIKEKGLVEIEGPIEDIKVPDPANEILRSPEAEREFKKTFEEVMCPSISVK